MDTNVLVSAILRDRTPEIVIQHIVEHPDFEWVASSEILAEYQAVLARPKFRLPQEVQNAWTTVLTAAIALVEEVDVSVEFPREIPRIRCFCVVRSQPMPISSLPETPIYLMPI